MNCQVSHCTNEAAAELILAHDAAINACAWCKHEPRVLETLLAGRNVGIYTFHGQRVATACTGDTPSTHAPVDGGVADVYTAGMWEPYWLPCIDCKEDFVFDWRGYHNFRCEGCHVAWLASRTLKEERPLQPLWDRVPARSMKRVRELYDVRITEHFEERAAIAEYDGNMPRKEAEQLTLASMLESSEKAGLFK